MSTTATKKSSTQGTTTAANMVVWSDLERAFFHDGPEDRGFTESLAGATRYTLAEARKVAMEYSPHFEDWQILTLAEAEDFLAKRGIPAPADTAQGELLPPDAGTTPPAPGELTGLTIESPVEAQMTALALSAHAADLTTLAKKARELGKLKEAASCDADAKLIRERLLPQLEPQAALPFGYESVSQALRDRIAGRLRRQLRAKLTEATPRHEGETKEDRDARVDDRLSEFEQLVGSVAEIVVPLVEPALVDAAARGEVAGRHARETTPASLALEALAAQEG